MSTHVHCEYSRIIRSTQSYWVPARTQGLPSAQVNRAKVFLHRAFILEEEGWGKGETCLLEGEAGEAGWGLGK